MADDNIIANNEDDDLYGDLSSSDMKRCSSSSQRFQRTRMEDSLIGSSSSTSLAATATTTSTTIASPSVDKRLQELIEENQTLKRNIGTLYRTAKAEIKRKNDEINRLLVDLEALKNRNDEWTK